MNATTLTNVPQELRDLRQWVIWRREVRKGKATKVPYRAIDSTRKAASNDPTTWSTYEQALAAWEKGRADGVGFVFSADDPYVGVDLDHCRDAETGELLPEAQTIVDEAATYIEASQSGTGAHLILRGELPEGKGRRAQRDGFEVEVYSAGRYFCMTGQRIGNVTEVRDCQVQLEALLARYTRKAPTSVAPAPTSAARLDDHELVEKALAASNGSGFAALWSGDTSAHGGDHSRADMALLVHLAFWTGSEQERMDRLFRQSALYREKWERVDYRERSIAEAIELNAGRHYTGIARSVAQYEPAPTAVGGPPLVHEGAHAEVLQTAWHDSWRWAAHEGAWRHWSRHVWEKADESVVIAAAQKVLRRHYGHCLASDCGSDESKRLYALHRATCRYASVLGGLAFLRGEDGFHTAFEKWDADPYTLNCADGLLDLHTQTLHPHDPAALCTKITRWSFAGTESTGAWERHLRLCLPDEDVRRQVQRDLGRALVGADLEESLPIWYGIGANGKSTTARALLQLVGAYGKKAAPNLLVASKFERHSTELADLAGARIVFSEEIEDGKHLAEALVKGLTGGTCQKARFMRQDFFEFEQSFTIFLLVNQRPTITGTDRGIWRRIRLVPWTVEIPLKEQRPQDDVVAELVADGTWMLRWLVAGFADWQADRHWVADEVKVATQAYRAEQDILADFLDRCCSQGPRATVPVDALYAAYEIDHAENADDGTQPLGKIAFGKRLKSRGLGQKRVGHDMTRMWHGVALNNGRDDQCADKSRQLCC